MNRKVTLPLGLAKALLLVTLVSDCATWRGAPACDTQPQQTLALAIDQYNKLEIEKSRATLLDLLTSGHHRLANSDQATVRKYLGAEYAIVGKTDSAVALFRGALALQPSLDLDRTAFSATEITAFARAKQSAAGPTVLPYRGCGG